MPLAAAEGGSKVDKNELSSRNRRSQKSGIRNAINDEPRKQLHHPIGNTISTHTKRQSLTDLVKCAIW